MRTEVRARTSSGQDATNLTHPDGGTAGDLELRPQLSGAVFNGPWTLSGGYTGTLFLREPYLKPRVDHAHVLQVDASWAREGSPRVFLDEYVNFGVLDPTTYGIAATPVSGAPPQPPGPVPLTQQLTSDTGLGVDWPLTRAVMLTTSAGYTFGGGLDKASQVSPTTALGPGGPILPLQSSPRAAARLAWVGSRFDTLAINLIGRFTSFQASDDCFTTFVCTYPGAQTVIGELSVNYIRLFAEHTSLDLTAGVTAAYGQRPGQAAPPGTLPMGGVGFSHRVQQRSARWEFRVSGLAAPFVDRFRGSVYERVEGNGSIGWGNAQRFYAYLRAGVSKSLTGVASTDLFTLYGETGGGYQGADWWRIDLTGREALQRGAPKPGPLPGTLIAAPWQPQWIVGLSATFTALSAPQTAATE